MKKLTYLCACFIPLLFTSCVTLDVLSTVIAVNQELNDISESRKKENEVEESLNKKSSTAETIVKVATSEKVVNSVKNALEDITPEKEYIIGRAVASSALGTYSLYENPAATRYVNKICAVLTANSEKPYLYKGYFVAILDTDEVNALSTPGGHILITRGLMECAESEDALAAVIAHEIAHIQLEHPIQAIRTSRVLNATTNVMSEIQSVNKEYSSQTLMEFNETRNQIYTTLIQTGFSKAQEFDADNYAMNLMSSAGYNPDCMIDLLKILEKNTSKAGWSKTHPKPSERIKKANAEKKSIRFKGESEQVRQNRFEQFKNTL